MIIIFEPSDSAERILEAVLVDGVAGIHGGRLAVRQRLGEVADLAETHEYETVMARSTVNHPKTELAYLYDIERYEHSEAREAVVAKFDAANP